jgi:predicted PurR-regulated permease PerM
LQGLLTSAAGVVNLLVFLVVVPVVAFYLLLDWDHMVARIDDLLPRDHAPSSATSRDRSTGRWPASCAGRARSA